MSSDLPEKIDSNTSAIFESLGIINVFSYNPPCCNLAISEASLRICACIASSMPKMRSCVSPKESRNLTTSPGCVISAGSVGNARDSLCASTSANCCRSSNKASLAGPSANSNVFPDSLSTFSGLLKNSRTYVSCFCIFCNVRVAGATRPAPPAAAVRDSANSSGSSFICPARASLAETCIL